MLEEARVIALVRAGEVDAFAGIVEHYQAQITRYLYRLTGDYEIAKDLTQDTFVQAYKGIMKTDADISFRAWLYRIATNNALQYHRRRKLLSFVRLAPGDAHMMLAEKKTGNQAETAAIEEALRYVPEEQRICLVLHFAEGFKYREIAETLNISEDAVRKRVARGRRAFIDCYSRRGDGEA